MCGVEARGVCGVVRGVCGVEVGGVELRGVWGVEVGGVWGPVVE